MSCLKQCHRSHTEASEPSGSSVSRNLISRNGRSSQNKLTGLPAIIYSATDMIPDRRLQLPLVDETRYLTIEHQCRIDCNSQTGVLIHIQKHLTGGYLSGRGCLPTCLGTFYDNSACR